MTQIVAVRSAFPAYRYPQADLAEAVASLAGLERAGAAGPGSGGDGGAAARAARKQRALLERLHANAGIDTRHTVFPLADYGALGAASNEIGRAHV